MFSKTPDKNQYRIISGKRFKQKCNVSIRCQNCQPRFNCLLPFSSIYGFLAAPAAALSFCILLQYIQYKRNRLEFLLAAGGKMILLDLRVTHNFEYFPSCWFWQIFIPPYIRPFFPHLFLLQILTHTGCSLNKIVTLVLRSTQ